MLILLLLACAEPQEISPGPEDVDCDGVPAAQDCDDRDDDRGVAPTWYTDADGDGFGDADAPLVACTRPDAAVADATDCDDTDPAASPGGAEVCGGGDEDCDGSVDEDACDDEACVHPSVATIEAVANLSIADVAFDDDCYTWLPNVVTQDSLQVVHPAGLVLAEWATIDGIVDLSAVAVDPVDGDVWVLGTDPSVVVGKLVDDALVPVAYGVYTQGSAWIGVYMNRVAQSIASDGECVYVPNFAGDGTLVCVRDDGTQETVATFDTRVESVAIAPDGVVWAAAGDTLYAVGGDETVTVDGTILDFVFAPDGSAYVETTADVVVHVDAGGTETFATVAYDGKLAITPDGWLVRVMPYWDGGTSDVASKWEEWELD